MKYQHTQTAPLHFLLLAFSVWVGFVAWSLRSEPPLAVAIAGVAVLVGIVAMSFRRLTVEDQGEFLRIRFGPIPLFGTRVAYSSMTAVTLTKSSWIDGWGIHYLPWRGWTFNLWGFNCVVVHCGKRVIRIGSNDAANLANFLTTKISQTNQRERVPSQRVR
jgi:hypothetical protein